MEENRYSEWVKNSSGVRFVDILLIGNVQGLGLIDVELIKEFPEIKIDSKLQEDLLKKLRHITLSELWVMGSYELIRLMKEIVLRDKDIFSNETKIKIKELLSTFTEIRIPLAKFQERGNNRLYSGVTIPKFDSVKGIGWEIIISNKKGVNTKIIYRKDLGDGFLELLRLFNKDINTKSKK
ncbi:MAG: hypothetical protein Q8N63_03525 [Nanoarchaeota archaeon]|nr:hypothetical protein [Nanoarchaeota archaeon]